MKPGQREAGFALLLVLWAVVLLALIGTQVTAAGRGEARLAEAVRNAAITEAAADAGTQAAIFHAIDASPAHWPADAAPHAIDLPQATVEVRIENEAGKVNLNTAPPELLSALLHGLGLDTTRATALSLAIADWRFPDAQRQGGARAEAYRAAGRRLGPPGAPFQSLEELGLVLGMTPGLLARITPYLTLDHDGAPDPRVASPIVVQALLASTNASALPPAGPEPPDDSVVAITARATGPGGTVFVRHCIAKIGQRAGGHLYQVLAWDARHGDGPTSGP